MAFCSVYGIISNRTFRLRLTICRYVRNVSRRGEGPKLLKGSVKTLTEHENDDYYHINNYQDFVKSVKSSVPTSDFEIETALTSDEDFGTALSKSARLDLRIRDEKDHKRFVKKMIISKKYFKLDLETNLLTHAAKEQIRYLHRINPTEWTPELLSQSFPVTVKGVKKLLKSNYTPKTPEKIKQHDKEVEERWEILQSGKPSKLISFHTQCMWDEGKILKHNYKGHPDLPIAPPENAKTILIQKKRITGEYSAIIQQYINYKKEKELSQTEQGSKGELQVVDDSMNPFKSKQKNVDQLNFRMNKYHVDDDTDDSTYSGTVNRFKKNKSVGEADVLHSQFKINLKEEKYSKKTSDPQYMNWLEEQCATETPENPKKPVRTKELFTKIPKYNNKTIELIKDKSKLGDQVYLYDDKFGYQHPMGKRIKSKIDLPANSHRKGTLYKVGQCVYDEYGELLYKIPGLEK